MDEVADLKQQIETLKKAVSNADLQLKRLENENAKLITAQKIYSDRTVALANASPNLVVQLTHDCKLIFINALARKTLNILSDNYVGKNIVDFIEPKFAEDIQNKVEAALLTNKSVESIFNFGDKYFRVVANVIDFENERTVLVISTNITEQINYETELRFKSILLQKVYDESSNALLVLDAQTTEVITCNRTAFKMFDFDEGVSLEKIKNHVLSAKVVPNTQQDNENTRLALEKYGVYIHETEFRTYTGRIFKSNYQVSLFQIDGKRMLFCKISDITETLKANQKLLVDSQKQKLHLEQSPLGYLEWNTNFEVVEWNPSAEKIFGYTREEALGKHAEFIIQDSEKKFTDEYWQILKTNIKGSRSKHYNINKKNELILVEWYNTPLFDEKGNLLGISCLIDNITDMANAEKELKFKTDFLETIYQEAFDSIMLFKPNSFEVVNCNKRSFELFEVENIDQLNILMPSARKKKQTKIERDNTFKLISEGEVLDKEIEFITAKGNSIWITMLVKLIEFNNETVELVRLTDVSPIKKINAQLNIDKQKQKIHIEHSPLGYVEWNNKFEVIEWNPCAEKIFGYSKSEAMHQNAKFILPEWEKNNVAKIWQTTLGYQGGHKGVFNNLNKNNELLTVEWYETPLFDEEGNVLGVSSIVNDITEKIKQEEELKYKTSFLETIYEEAFDGIMLFEPNTYNVLNCNKRTFEIFETNSLEQLNQYMPNARKNKLNQQERMQMFKEIEQKDVYDKDIEFITYKGKTIWLSMLVKLIKLDGVMVELVRVTDVSDLRYINAKLNLDRQKQKLLVEQSPLGYLEIDDKNIIKEWNPSAEKIFGFTRNEAIGKHINIIVPEPLLAMVENNIAELNTSKSSSRNTHQNITKSLELISVEWYNSTIYDENGKYVGLGSLINDITDKIKAKNEIESQLKEKKVLLSEIHHRVKNNLAVISGLLYMHAEHIEDENLKQILKESQSRIKSMAIIHEQLYQTENFGNINVNIYLKELVKKIASTFSSENKIIDLDIEVNDFSMPISQALIIGLVINELVINSYKYAFENTDKGKIKIRFEKKGKHILRVFDNGIGYKEDYNFEKSNSLGLNLVKILAKQLKGDVLFENKKGAYCTLIFN